MSKSFKENLVGKKFGRLTVLEFVPTEDAHSVWLCRCDCGNFKSVRKNQLITKHVKSCGCLVPDTNKSLNTKHGKSRTRLYRIWNHMKDRCYNPANKRYKNYGGRGILVCDEWLNDFVAFRNWALSHGYADTLSIDRLDVNGNYEPNNCRWATTKEQNFNTTRNIYVHYNDKTIPLTEASALSSIGFQTPRHRYHNGDRGDRLFRPVKK